MHAGIWEEGVFEQCLCFFPLAASAGRPVCIGYWEQQDLIDNGQLKWIV